MNISCLIVDDEPLARNRLVKLISEVPELICLGESKTGKEAVFMIESLEPDLIFLDIKMKDMTGFEVLKKINIKHMPIVIFVTAFDKYALKAFNVFAFDYLLKPFKKSRFDAAIKRVVEFLDSSDKSFFDKNLSNLLNYLDTSKEINNIKSKLPIKTGRTVSFLDVKDIKYILASGSYIDIHTVDKIHVLRSSLTDILDDINNLNFRRIHRSSVININFMTKLLHSQYGEIDVKMSDNKILRISGSYKKEFLKALGI